MCCALSVLHSCLLLSSTPLDRSTTAHCSQASGLLSFYFGSVTSSVMNLCVSFDACLFYILLGVDLGVELLGNNNTSSKSTNLFSKAAAPFYNRASNA